MRYLILLLLAVFPVNAASSYQYTVVANVDDEKLVLIDSFGETHVVEAQAYCYSALGFDEGDTVLAVDSLNACAMTTLISLSQRQTCKVWCP